MSSSPGFSDFLFEPFQGCIKSGTRSRDSHHITEPTVMKLLPRSPRALPLQPMRSRNAASITLSLDTPITSEKWILEMANVISTRAPRWSVAHTLKFWMEKFACWSGTSDVGCLKNPFWGGQHEESEIPIFPLSDWYTLKHKKDKLNGATTNYSSILLNLCHIKFGYTLNQIKRLDKIFLWIGNT